MAEFTITRVLDAPRDLVFRAWTDPRQVTCWLGPRGVTTPLDTISMDVRPGGEWRVCMVRDDDGSEYPTGGYYRDVVEPERLVFTWGVAVGPGDIRDESVVTLTFEDLGGKTLMTLHQAGFETEEQRVNVRSGWTECAEKLAEYVTSQGENR